MKTMPSLLFYLLYYLEKSEAKIPFRFLTGTLWLPPNLL